MVVCEIDERKHLDIRLRKKLKLKDDFVEALNDIEDELFLSMMDNDDEQDWAVIGSSNNNEKKDENIDPKEKERLEKVAKKGKQKKLRMKDMNRFGIILIESQGLSNIKDLESMDFDNLNIEMKREESADIDNDNDNDKDNKNDKDKDNDKDDEKKEESANDNPEIVPLNDVGSGGSNAGGGDAGGGGVVREEEEENNCAKIVYIPLYGKSKLETLYFIRRCQFVIDQIKGWNKIVDAGNVEQVPEIEEENSDEKIDVCTRFCVCVCDM